MTAKPYLSEPLIMSFEANVIDAAQQDDGKTALILDQTYFYPTGGGQSHDVGTIC